MNKLITLIFPAYNEASSIKKTVDEAVAFFESHQLSYEIIVSADGEDGTRDIVGEMGKKNPNIKAIGSVKRRGKGYGIRQAIKIARGDIIGFSDADNKTPITEFEAFLPKFDEGNDIVIGSRGNRKTVIERPQPWYRQIGSKGFAIFMHMVTGLWDISDTQCGFKFFTGKAARYLFAIQQIDGYMYDVEILFLAKKAGYKIAQMPVRWRDDGDSRLDLVKGNISNFKDVLSLRFRSYPVYSEEKKE